MAFLTLATIQETGLPPSAENLKYLAFKNHGILLLSDIKNEKTDIDEEEYAQRVEIVIDEFSEALSYNSDDDTFLSLFAALCEQLGYYRLARLCYETIIVSPSRLKNIFDTFISNRFSNPQDVQTLRSLYRLCIKIKDSFTLDLQSAVFKSIAQLEIESPATLPTAKLSFITPTPLSELAEYNPINPCKISIVSYDWPSIIQALQDHAFSLTSTKSKKKLTTTDPYSISSKPSNSISFNVSNETLSKYIENVSDMNLQITEESENKDISLQEPTLMDLDSPSSTDAITQNSDDENKDPSQENLIEDQETCGTPNGTVGDTPAEVKAEDVQMADVDEIKNDTETKKSDDKEEKKDDPTKETEDEKKISQDKDKEEETSKKELSDDKYETEKKDDVPDVELKDESVKTAEENPDAAQNNKKCEDRKRRRRSELSSTGSEEPRARTSKRFKTRSTEEPASLADVDLSEDNEFFSQLSLFLSPCKFSFDSMAKIFNGQEDYPKKDLYIADFFDTLKNDKKSPEIVVLATMKNGPSKSTETSGTSTSSSSSSSSAPHQSILNQLLEGPNSIYSLPTVTRPSKLPPSPESIQFISTINSHHFHFQEVRVNLLRQLFGVQNPDDLSIISPVVSSVWPLSTIKSLTYLAQYCDDILQQFPKFLIKNSSKATEFEIINEIFITQVILELFVNNYIGICSALKKKIGSVAKLNTKDLENKQTVLQDLYITWKSIFINLVSLVPSDSLDKLKTVLLRHKWVTFLISKSSSDNPWDNGDDFTPIISHLENTDPDLKIEYPNFVFIPSFSLESIKSQVSRYKAISTLSEIFEDPPGLKEIREEEENDPVPPPISKSKRKEDGHKSKGKSKQTAQEREKEKEKEKQREKEEEAKREKLIEERNARVADRKKRETEIRYDASIKRIGILERVLLPPQSRSNISSSSNESEEESSEYSAISKFLLTANLDLRLNFWNLLIADYNNVGEKLKALDGYLSIFCDIVKEFTSEKYYNQPTDKYSSQKRRMSLLKSVYMCFDATNNLVPLITSVEDFKTIPKEKIESVMTSTISILRMLYIYILYEDSIINNVIPAPEHPDWEKCSPVIKELFVRSWYLFYYCYQKLLPQDERTLGLLTDILSIIHEQLGNRGYCCLADGIFLDLIIRELVRIKFDDARADLVQALNCRYDLVLGGEEFHPYDHETTAIDMDKDTAFKVLPTVMDIILKRKSLAQNVLRADVKGALDEMFEAIKFPDKSVSSISRNAFNLARTMETNVDIPFLQRCFQGVDMVDFYPTPKDVDILSSSGFYFLLSQTRMALFKVRKRTIAGHTEDLSEAIKFLKYDLMCGDYNRFETWYQLAQGYDGLVEDDLTWDAEKITNEEFHHTTVSRQCKSIISGAIAINRLLQVGPSPLFENTPTYQNMKKTIWPFFARMLFNASQCPMNMDAFHHVKEKIHCGPDGIYNYTPKYSLKPPSIIRVALFALNLGQKENPDDWYTYYLKGQMLHKLKSPPKDVLDAYLQSISCLSEKHNSHSEVILEPHYKLISNVYKYLRNKQIDQETALKYLDGTMYKDDKISLEFDDDPDNSSVYSICLSSLVKLRAADKKKVHHRPTYRIAKIYDDAEEIYKAKEEMSTFFLLKANSKIPLQIWKTDYERPGQHFEYTRKYTHFFITLLERTWDIEAFGFLSKCLRKFKSGMLRHQETWEFLCTCAARMLKEILEIPSRYSEKVIAKIGHDEFYVNTAKLLAYNEEKDTPLHPMTKFLNYTAELRRLNNGFGSTAALDDLFVSLYLIIYNDFVDTVIAEEIEQEKKEKQLREELERQKEKQRAEAPKKISVMDLLSDPITSDADSSAPSPMRSVTDTPKSAGNSKKSMTPGGKSSTPSNKSGNAQKVRVTRRDIISRSLALLRSALHKLIATDSRMITKENTPLPTRIVSSSSYLKILNADEAEKSKLKNSSKREKEDSPEERDLSKANGNTEDTFSNQDDKHTTKKIKLDGLLSVPGGGDEGTPSKRSKKANNGNKRQPDQLDPESNNDDLQTPNSKTTGNGNSPNPLASGQSTPLKLQDILTPTKDDGSEATDSSDIKEINQSSFEELNKVITPIKTEAKNKRRSNRISELLSNDDIPQPVSIAIGTTADDSFRESSSIDQSAVSSPIPTLETNSATTEEPNSAKKRKSGGSRKSRSSTTGRNSDWYATIIGKSVDEAIEISD